MTLLIHMWICYDTVLSMSTVYIQFHLVLFSIFQFNLKSIALLMEHILNVSCLYSVSFDFIWFHLKSMTFTDTYKNCYETVHGAFSQCQLWRRQDLLWQTLAISCHSCNCEKILWLIELLLNVITSISCKKNHIHAVSIWLNSVKCKTVLESQFSWSLSSG